MQSATATVASIAAVDVAGVERSALYKINPDNTVETLWSSKEENAYDLVLASGDLMFVTDTQGRIRLPVGSRPQSNAPRAGQRGRRDTAARNEKRADCRNWESGKALHAGLDARLQRIV